ncbi:hypothetical protein CYCD_30060 [Tenuifilaceae bacterium CYCD]|nr:hypothetical protein CYCD_30060 [Tenuifilaceae bacterium CYCD]
MRKLTLCVIVLFLSLYISAQVKVTDTNLVLFDGYLYGNIIEKPELECNNIYKREGVFTFSYRFFDKNGKELFFYINKDGSWDFIDVNRAKDNVVKDFQFKILDDNMNYSEPKYYQTGISYIINKKNLNYDMTGLIENEKNIWLHPPREFLFQILELNPYPYIKYPLEIGHRWSWKLRIGSAWGDKRWKQWKGIVEFNYKYSIVDKKTIKTKLGDLTCFVIESEAISVLGKTKLTSYFNSKYGFVKLDYTNIDNSKLEIVLQGVTFPMFKVF